MNLTPKALQESINAVSQEYFILSQELAEIASKKGTTWLEIKREHETTNAETDKLWDATLDGSREAYLRIYLRGLQAKRGALVLELKSNSGFL